MRWNLPEREVWHQSGTAPPEISAIEEAAAEERYYGTWAEEDERADMGPEPIHPDTEVY